MISNFLITDEPPPFDLFTEVLKESKTMVSSWGGELYFVYLPEWTRYAKKPDDVYFPYHYEQVLSIVKELDIPIIDINEYFASHPDPLSLFPFRMYGHYNSEGYGLTANAIIEHMEKIKAQKIKPAK